MKARITEGRYFSEAFSETIAIAVLVSIDAEDKQVIKILV